MFIFSKKKEPKKINALEDRGKNKWSPKLEKVRGCCSRWYDPLRVRYSPEELGLSPVHVLKHHDGSNVSTAVTVVGGGPYRDQLLIEHELVALVNELMGATDELQVVDVNKLWRGERLRQHFNIKDRLVVVVSFFNPT